MFFLRIPHASYENETGAVKYLHTKNAYDSSTAYELKENIKIRISVPRTIGVRGAYLDLYNESLSLLTDSIPLVWDSDDGANDVYIARLSACEVGLYFYKLRFDCAFGTLYGYKSCTQMRFSSSAQQGESFQLSVVDFAHPATQRISGGIIYHIFVDRFARGKEVPLREDAIYVDEWYDSTPTYPQYPGAHLENNNFYGGTLWGVIDKLDYIKSLGVNTIYLSPIFEAYSNHKYDTGNYMKVDDMFGGDEALRQLIERAHELGIGIILDGVFNHTGADSVYFNRYGKYDALGAYQSQLSPYYSWYDFQNYPNEYTCWWGIKILPRINPDIKECGDFIAGNGGVIEKYTAMGIDGFRLDVADELSDEFIARIKAKQKQINPDSILYGEVWEDASNKISYEKRKKYYLGRELDGVMNYPLRTGIIAFLRDHDSSALSYALCDVMNNAPRRVRDRQMNLLGTHDTVRILTTLGGELPDGKSNSYLANAKMTFAQRKRAIRLLKIAYTVLATLPGIPTIFYADEAGMEGYSDPFNRRCFPWGREDGDLLSHYRAIGKIRTEHSVFSDGEFQLLHLDDELLLFSRFNNAERIYTVVNNSSHKVTLEFSGKVTSLVGNASVYNNHAELSADGFALLSAGRTVRCRSLEISYN